MPQLRLFIMTLQPSWISNAVVIVGSLIILGQANWSYVTYNPEWYDLFYGQFGITTAFEGAPNVLRGWQEGVFMSPVIYGALVILAAFVAACILFFTIRIGTRVWHALRLSLESERHEMRQRVMARGAILGAWTIYMFITISLLTPFCILLSRIGAEELSTPEGITQNLIAGGLLVLTLHGHVIFIRLFCLRPRLLNSQRLMTEAFLSKR